MSIESIQTRMEAKAAEDKGYYMDIWESHITGLCRMTEIGEGCLSYDRYLEIKAELMANAEAAWEQRHGS